MPQFCQEWLTYHRLCLVAYSMEITRAMISKTGIFIAVSAFALLMTQAQAEQRGVGSWYSLPGNTTACGQKMNPGAMTAAHRTHRCGTKLRVTNRKNGKSVIVTVNDRGPFIKGRIVDVSKAAGRRIGLMSTGVAPVSVAVVQ
jgi:rare lipoprotein A